MSRQEGLVRTERQSLVQSDQRPAVAPACDVYENNDEILVVADVPGVSAEDLDINLDKGELSIVARRNVSPKEGTFVGVEYRDCDYRRRFAVPGGIDAGKISAELKDGVLWLHLPKSEALKPRQIAVRAG
jgi:HSP20 family molecular chaperone IbpA